MTTFIDERSLTLWISPSGLTHVGSWFGETVCGKYHYGWSMGALTSLRQLGRMSRSPKGNRFCKNCANEYKDVRDD